MSSFVKEGNHGVVEDLWSIVLFLSINPSAFGISPYKGRQKLLCPEFIPHVFAGDFSPYMGR